MRWNVANVTNINIWLLGLVKLPAPGVLFRLKCGFLSFTVNSAPLKDCCLNETGRLFWVQGPCYPLSPPTTTSSSCINLTVLLLCCGLLPSSSCCQVLETGRCRYQTVAGAGIRQWQMQVLDSGRCRYQTVAGAGIPSSQLNPSPPPCDKCICILVHICINVSSRSQSNEANRKYVQRHPDSSSFIARVQYVHVVALRQVNYSNLR